jgi:transposase
MPTSDLEIQGVPVAHLPVLRALIDELGIHSIIDAALPKHALSRVSDADCVVTMMLNVLCGRVALYRMDEWLGRTDVELLLGPGREADAFDDSRLAIALDHVDTIGTDWLLTAVVKEYLDRPNRETVYSVHQDFTSYSFYGEYDGVSPAGPVPTYGHSKDLRPDLKQLVFGLSLHGNAGIPLVCSTLDGNTSDTRANRDHLARLVKLLPDEDEVTIVGDCKLVDGQTLGQLRSAGFHFVSLLPDAYNLRAELVRAAWEAEADVSQWPLLGSHPGRLKADPTTLYRGRSVEAPFPVLLHRAPRDGGEGPPEGVPSVETMRFLIVHSDSLAALFDAQLDARLTKENAEVAAAVARVNRKPASCEKDALRAAAKTMPKLRFHVAELTAVAEIRPIKRPTRGRPPKGAETVTETVWLVSAVVELNAATVASERQHASCFPLVTSHLETPGWDDARILAEYRHQGLVEGTTGFRWLKGPAAVSPMFLKTPTRMRALGLVMILALMVRNLWQFRMRSAARAAGEKITHPFTKRPVSNLTAEMAMAHFGGMQTLRLRRGDSDWTRVPQAITTIAKQILGYLGVPEAVFWTPPRPKKRTLVI